jgi:hypothetical protein
MNPVILQDGRWKVAMGLAFAMILGIFGFGSGVQVPFLEPSIPLSKAVECFSLGHAWDAFIHQELGLTLWAAAGILYTRMVVKPGSLQIGLMIAGLLMPVVVTEPVFFAMMLASPLIVAKVLCSSPDGEFYGEQMLPAAALGGWMLLCFADLARSGWKWIRRTPDP